MAGFPKRVWELIMNNALQTPYQLIGSDEARIKLLINSGFALVSIPFGQKCPLRKSWNTQEKVIDSIDKVRQLSGMNVGLAHAFCTPNPTCSIDLDDVIRATEWLSDREVDLATLKNAPDAVGIISGKSNSFKLLYRLPDGFPALASKVITGKAGDTALEFRCATKDGRTVQCVLPPSIHPSGSQYRWVGAGSILNLPTLPDSLLKIWLELLLSKERHPRPNSLSISTPETPRQIAILNKKLACIDADCDYDTYRNVIWGIASTGWSCAYEIAIAWSLTAEHRFEEHTLDTIFFSYDPNRDGRITAGTIHHYAKQGA
jgi:putative DNA primase/helicase